MRPSEAPLSRNVSVALASLALLSGVVSFEMGASAQTNAGAPALSPAVVEYSRDPSTVLVHFLERIVALEDAYRAATARGSQRDRQADHAGADDCNLHLGRVHASKGLLEDGKGSLVE